jgi:hypothetical protein
MNEAGFVYVATGAGYVVEARRSAQSLRQHHPDSPICLITDQPVATDGVFTVVQAPQGRVDHMPIDKIAATGAPFARCVFVDTDTCILGSLTPLFQVLDRFEIAVTQDVNRGWDYPMPDVPMAFSEFNTGVIAFRNEPIVHALFADWRARYDRLRRDLGLTNDQPAFRQALYHSSLRVAPLPSEFHFLCSFPNAALWDVRLLHGRGNHAQISADVNAILGPRAYIPDVGAVPRFAGRRGWIGTTWRVFRRMLRLVFHPPADSAAANPGQWWRETKDNSKSVGHPPL